MATINGNDSANILTGGVAADTLNGLGGNDTLFGNAGDDTLDGGTGNDRLLGGRGSDTYRFGQGYGFDVIDNSGGANSDVDILRLTNLNANQIRLTRMGNDLVLTVLATGETITVSQCFLDADHAIDRIQFADGSSWGVSEALANLYYPPVVPTNGADVINGNPTDDTLLGLGGNDTLYGNSGNDTLDGGSGNDRMEGGVGNDTYVVGAAGDVVVEASNAGDDLVQASINYTLGSNLERLTLIGSANINGTGNALANTLIGNAGNNLLDGGAGNDLIQGGDGNDTLQGGAGNDSLNGDAGNDLLDGGAGNDSMAGGSGDDIYIVDQSGDSVSELVGGGNDTVRASLNYSLGANLENLELTGSVNLNGTGNALANQLIGNTGNNLLNGGAGDDVLVGRRGSDTYVYGTNYGNDVIDNSGGVSADVDTVQLVGLNSNNVRFVHTGNDLQMVVLATSQTLTLKNFYLGADYEIDQVRFGNNVVWNTAALKAAATIPVNSAPSSTNDTQTTLEDTPLILGSTDFGTYSDAENSPLAAVRITTLPTLGSLQYNNGSAWVAVVQDQVISKADLDAGKLQFVPALNGNGSGYAGIGFKVSDGTTFAVNANTLNVNVTAVNDAPTVSGPVSLPDGVEDSAYAFTAAQLLANASDVDVGDSLSVQSVSVDPSDGSITANPNGSWTFNPALDRNGLVNFALVIADSAGATVATSANLSLAPVVDAPAAVATVTALSEDSGTAGDFLTNVDSQTVSGTYTGTLNTGETIQVSADGGTTWVNAAADSATHSWSASGVTLISSGTGLLVQTINPTGNSRAGTGHSYTLDTSADVGNDLRVVLADSLINNAEKTAVAYSVTGLDADASATVTFSDASNHHVVGVNGSANLSSLNDGPISVSIVATDVAGNSASRANSVTNNLTFDNIAPGSPLGAQYVALGVIVSGANIINSSAELPSHSGTNLAYSELGLMTFTFNSAIGNIQSVSAYVSGDAGTGLFAFSAAGTLIGQAVLASGAVNTLLTVTSGVPIARLEIHSDGSFLGVDDLTFSTTGSLTLDTSADRGGDLTVTLADALISNAEKTAVAYTVAGLDADASATVSFSDGIQSVVGVNGSADLSSLSDGPISVSVTASDTAGNTASGIGSTFTLDTTAPLVSGPVTLTDGSEDSAYTFSAAQLLANTSGSGNSPSVKSVNVSPNDGTLTDHGNGSWTFTPAANRNGAVTFNVVVTDGGNDVATSANLNLAPVNDAPTLASPLIDQNASQNSSFSFSVPIDTFVDVDGETLSYSASLASGEPLPSWLSFDANTLTFGGTPAQTDVGAIDLRVSANDAAGLMVSGLFRLTVNNVNDSPTGSVSISGNATKGQVLTASHTLVDLDGLGAITYQWQVSADGSNWGDIAGASGATFTLSAAEIGRQVRVEARYTDGGGSAESVASGASAAVDAQIQGDADNNDLLGTPLPDHLSGLAGDDSLSGQDGDDLLDGGAGNDWLSGGVGIDTARYAGSMSQYQLSFDQRGYLTVEATTATGEAGLDTLEGIERLQFADGTVVVEGVPGGELRVNSTTASAQDYPSVTGLADGGYVVSWMSLQQDGSGWGIYAQRYGANGAALGGELRVNSTTASDQQNPMIAALADGGYVVSWMSFDQDGSGGIYAQRYAVGGAVVGGEVRVSSAVASNQQSPTIAALADGGYVVSWMSHQQDGSGWGIYAQRYDADGAPLGGEVEVNSTTASDQTNPTITALADGGYAVSWRSFVGIYAQRYDASGAAVGGEMLVNGANGHRQEQPTIGALADGGYVVSWQSSVRGTEGYDIYVQRCLADGTVQGGEVLVHSITTFLVSGLNPRVAGLVDGGYVVSWQSPTQDSISYDIYAQRYTANGTVMGGAVRVNSTTVSDQVNPAIAALSDGGYLVSWMSYDQGGSSVIYAQRYGADGQPLAASQQLVGDSGNNFIQLGSRDDRFAGGGGNDTVHAGDGVDTALYQGNQRDFILDVHNVSELLIADQLSAEGSDTLHDVERVEFGDGVDMRIVSELVVNTTWGGQQPRIAGLVGGGYVVAWQSFDQPGSDLNIYMQRYTPEAGLVGGIQRVNSTTAGNQAEPSVSALVDGGWIVTWFGSGANGSDVDIYMQRYMADGSAQGNETRVNTNTSGFQGDPAVAGLPDGGWVLSWESNANGWGVYLQRYSANGSPEGSEVSVNNSTNANGPGGPSITALSDGGWLLAWVSDDGNIYQQRYAEDGNAFGAEQLVNLTVANNSSSQPPVTALFDGGWLMTWESYDPSGSNSYDIYAQRYAADGTAQGEFRVNSTTTGVQVQPSVTALADGGYVVSWQSYLQNGIYAQRYGADGNTLGGEVVVNTTTINNEFTHSVAALADGGYAVIWQVRGFGIYSQRYDANGNPVVDHLEWSGDASANLIRSTLETDWFSGGTGADTFQFVQLPGDRADLITDFTQGSDAVALNSALFNLQGQTVADTLANVSGEQHEAAGAHLAFNQNDHTLYYDADGAANGNAVAVVTLTGVATLTASDVQMFV